MLAFLSENIGTIAVGLVVLAVVALVLRKMIRDKRKGKTACGCGCGNCPSQGMCHTKE